MILYNIVVESSMNVYNEEIKIQMCKYTKTPKGFINIIDSIYSFASTLSIRRGCHFFALIYTGMRGTSVQLAILPLLQ